MTGSRDLTLEYMERHPAGAARVLESLQADQAAALLKSIPGRLGTPVVGEMLPTRAAACMEHLSDALVVGFLARLRPQLGTPILRQLARKRRTRILGQMPTSRALVYRLLLGYPDDTVGAWVEPDVLSVSTNARAGDVLERARGGTAAPDGLIYVIDERRRLRGMVGIQELLRAQPDTQVSHLSAPAPAALPAQATLDSVRDHGAWSRASSLPVEERRKGFIGVLRHSTLIRSALSNTNDSGQYRLDSTLASVAGLYWTGISTLIRATVAVLPGSTANNAPTEADDT